MEQRCIYCHQILGHRYLVNYWGEAFCPEHQLAYPTCECCGRLVPSQPVPVAGLRDRPRYEGTQCDTCRSQAIVTSDRGYRHFCDVVDWLKSDGLLFNPVNDPRVTDATEFVVELCSRARLGELVRATNGGHVLGAAIRTRAPHPGVMDAKIRGVALLIGLPPTLFEGVVAHELGHVWTWVHSIFHLPDWAEEGFCNLLQYRYYGYLGTTEARYYQQGLERSPDPVYGEGFRRVRALANLHGFATLMRDLRVLKCLPSV